MSYNSKYKGAEVEELLDSIGDKVDKVDGKQLSTEDFTTLLKQKLEGLSNYDDTAIQESVSKLRTDLDTLVSGDTTTAIKTFNEVIAFLDGLEDTEDLASIIASIEQQITGKQNTITDLTTIREGASKGATAVQSSDLAKVATSGSYNDLSNKPTIPSAVTESTVSGWGFTKNTGTYSKPSTGIPKSDLASAVQTSLGKADTALQSYTEQYKGTVSSVKINGSTKTPDSNGLVDLGTISGGGSSSGSSAYPLVEHGTSDTTFTLTPNTFHVWDEVASLDLSLGAETSGVANEYLLQFTSGSTATTLTLPSDIKWANDTAPTIAANMIYQVSILRGLACVLEFRNTVALIENHASSSGRVITFDYPVASDLTISYSYRGSSYQVSIAAGEQSVTAGDTIHSIDSITPSSDGTYNYTFDIS